MSFGSALLSDSCALLTTYACFHASLPVTPCTSQSNAQSLHTDLYNPFTFGFLFSLERRCQRQSFRAYWLLGVSMFSSHLLGLRLAAIAWQRWGWAGLGGVGEDQVVGQGKECCSCAKVWMPWKKGDLEEYILIYWVSPVFNMVILNSGTFSADLEVQSFPSGSSEDTWRRVGRGYWQKSTWWWSLALLLSSSFLLAAHTCTEAIQLRMVAASHRKGARAQKALLPLLLLTILACFLLYFPTVLFTSLCRAEREIQKYFLVL